MEPRAQAGERNPKVVHRTLSEGQAVLLHLESGQYHELNEIGALIWQLLDGARSAADIAASLDEQLDDSPGDLEAIVDGFLADLRSRDLLR